MAPLHFIATIFLSTVALSTCNPTNITIDSCTFNMSNYCTQPTVKLIFNPIMVHKWNHEYLYTCTGFTKFEDTKTYVECINTSSTAFVGAYYFPLKPILLDSGFITPLSVGNKRWLFNLKGIDVSFDYNFNHENSLQVDFSHLDFYFDGERIDDNLCEKLWQTGLLIFPFFNLSIVTFGRNVRYTLHTCPYVFHSISIDLLILFGLSNSVTRRNELKFSHTKNEASMDFFNFDTVYLFLYNYDIDESLMHPYTLGRVSRLFLQNNIKTIGINTFKALISIFSIEISISNLRAFLHGNTSWMVYLNYRNKGIDVSNVTKKNIEYIRNLKSLY